MSDEVTLHQLQAVRSTLSRLLISCEDEREVRVLRDLCVRSAARAEDQAARTRDRYLADSWRVEASAFTDMAEAIDSGHRR
jgi:hypothetical protein